MGENCWIIDCHIDKSSPFLIQIGNNVTITEARILTHDASLYNAIGYTRLGKVVIGNNCFLGKQCIVLPGTVIGDNVIIGAGAVVAKDIPSNSVVIGNPCRILCTYTELVERTKKQMEQYPVTDLIGHEIEKTPIKDEILESGFGFCK